MKNKKVVFKPKSEYVQEVQASPATPSSKTLPMWYRNTLQYTGGNDLLKSAKTTNPSAGTFKLCVPVTDAMSAGYMITLPATILVTQDVLKQGPTITWGVNTQITDVQIPEVLGGTYPVPKGFSPQFFRWHFNWVITTPPGYSLWVTHPSHRWDLPFMTLNGFVDTDKHPNNLLLPFFLREGFEGTIEEGTPIAQVIPVKRDSWNMEKKSFDVKYTFGDDLIKKSFIRGYKNYYWSKKIYQ